MIIFVVHVKAKDSLFLFNNWGLPEPYSKAQNFGFGFGLQ
jgi:hypothetical protein